jgi:hypothetical protein
MTRNAENHHIVHMAPFRGFNQNADEEDVADGYFVDGENLVCTEKPGVVTSRPGYGHWLLDENGYGVVFTEPIAILPGGGSIDGVLTPPAVATLLDSTLTEVNEDPENVPSSGPGTNGSIPTPTPDDDDGDVPPVPDPPPVGGGIALHANPSEGLWVTASTSVTVTYLVTEDLPEGVTIGTYAWDYVYAGTGAIGSDATGSATTSSHEYTVSDPEFFQAIVRGTGSDSVVYADAVNLHIENRTTETPDGFIKIRLPEVEVVPKDSAFRFEVAYFELNATGDYTLATTDYDVAVSQLSGTATLKDSVGGDLPGGGSVIGFTSASTGSEDYQATLESGVYTGEITVQAKQESTGFKDQKTLQVSTAYILAEIVDSSGNAVTSVDQVYDETDETLTWTFYVRLTAKDIDGATETDFAEIVEVKYAHDPNNSSWDEDSDYAVMIVSYDSNNPYSSETEVIANSLGVFELPTAVWAAGTAGVVTLKIEVSRAYTEMDDFNPSENLNAGYAALRFWGEVVNP